MLLPLEYHFPNKEIEPENLDKFLADGYFRTGNYLLRTRVLYYDQLILNTLHIRIALDNHRITKRLEKKFRQNNSIFTHIVQPFKITEEKERLYQLHRKRFIGNNSVSLAASFIIAEESFVTNKKTLAGFFNNQRLKKANISGSIYQVPIEPI